MAPILEILRYPMNPYVLCGRMQVFSSACKQGHDALSHSNIPLMCYNFQVKFSDFSSSMYPTFSLGISIFYIKVLLGRQLLVDANGSGNLAAVSVDQGDALNFLMSFIFLSIHIHYIIMTYTHKLVHTLTTTIAHGSNDTLIITITSSIHYNPFP